MKNNSLFILLILCISCQEASNPETNRKNVQLNGFSMEMPETWTNISESGIDSSIEFIVIGNSDSVVCDFVNATSADRLGFNEWTIVYPLTDKPVFDSAGYDKEIIFFSATPVMDQAQGLYSKYYYLLDTIGGKPAKLKLPKKVGEEAISVVFPGFSGNESLVILAPKLDSVNQNELIKAIYTIK